MTAGTTGEMHPAPDAPDTDVLKRQLQRANRVARWKALGLVAPLLIFLLVTFVVPIFSMLTRSVHSPVFGDIFVETAQDRRMGRDRPAG